MGRQIFNRSMLRIIFIFSEFNEVNQGFTLGDPVINTFQFSCPDPPYLNIRVACPHKQADQGKGFWSQGSQYDPVIKPQFKAQVGQDTVGLLHIIKRICENIPFMKAVDKLEIVDIHFFHEPLVGERIGIKAVCFFRIY